MLNQIAAAHAIRGSVGKAFSNHAKLVIAREYLSTRDLARLGVLGSDNLCVVLKDVSETGWREDFFPEVVRLEPDGIRRIPRSVVNALIEGKEPRGLTLQARTHLNLGIIHREMNNAAPELKKLFARIAVAFVLLHCIGSSLLREAVLQLEGRDG